MSVATSTIERTQQLGQNAKESACKMAAEYGAAYAAHTQPKLDEIETSPDDGIVTRARNAGTVISVVVIGVVALVGLLIFGEVYNAMPLENEVFNESGALEDAPEDILGGATDAIGLVPIILLVLLASVVIGVVQRMRGR